MSAPGEHLRARAGFTLLEVMVSLGILAVALMAIGDVNGGAVRMHSYAKHVVVAVQLARGKMLDLQFQLRKDGLSDFSREYHGDFDKEGRPEYKWKAQVLKPEIDIPSTKLVELIGNGLGLNAKDAQGSGGAGAAAAAASPLMQGPMAGLVDAQAKQFIEVVKGSLREVKLSVTWREGSKDESFDLVEHVVLLPDAAQRVLAELRPQGGGGALDPAAAAAAAAAGIDPAVAAAAAAAGLPPGALQNKMNAPMLRNPLMPIGGAGLKGLGPGGGK